MEVEVVGREGKTTSHDTTILIRIVKIILFTAAFVVVPCFFFFFNNSSLSFQFSLISSQGKERYKLDKILKSAAMMMEGEREKTVILTTVNQAWAANNSLLDLFVESFRIGDNTERLLNHLVVITLDQHAYDRCISVHPHHRNCYLLHTKKMDFSKEAFFMSHDYLEMMWRRIDFLRSVLHLGYSFIFTDVDIMWFRDPMERFDPKADFQIACDNFRGNPYDINNSPNGGFTYVKSNYRTIEFYKFWYSSRVKYPGNHDQDVLNKIKYDPFIKNIGLEIRFLDTAYFGGFCEPSKDLDLVCTMHANCCVGLANKIHDLRIILDDWRIYKSFSTDKSLSPSPHHQNWTVPQRCGLKSFPEHDSPP